MSPSVHTSQTIHAVLHTASLTAFYTDRYVLPLPQGHRFPMAKYAMLRQAALNALDAKLNLVEPPAATDGQLALAHHPDYIARMSSGQVDDKAMRLIGFPWSEQMVERSRRSSGATIAAARVAFEQGIAINLAGGTHHACHDHGEGYCVFNDAAVTARLMQAERRAVRVAIVDLDVHQGNGTADILGQDDSIYTLSVHGLRNYPFRKECSHDDVALPDGTDDVGYLQALEAALERLFAAFNPGLIIYLAGADCHEGDRLGRLKLTFEGLQARDALVLRQAYERQVPAVVCMAGGYGKQIEDTVQVHLNTVLAAAYWRERWAARYANASGQTHVHSAA